MSPAEFDKLVEKAMKVVPLRFRRRLKNVVFIVEPEPPSPNLLGLYHGRPLPHRSVSDGFTLPDRITIFQGPHERLARDRRHFSVCSKRPCGTKWRTTSAWTKRACGGPNICGGGGARRSDRGYCGARFEGLVGVESEGPGVVGRF